MPPQTVTARMYRAVGCPPVPNIFVSRVHQAVTDLLDNPHRAWAGNSVWVDETPGMRVDFSVLVFLLSGCDFPPCLDGPSFPATRNALVKGLRVEGLVPKALLRYNGGLLIL